MYCKYQYHMFSFLTRSLSLHAVQTNLRFIWLPVLKFFFFKLWDWFVSYHYSFNMFVLICLCFIFLRLTRFHLKILNLITSRNSVEITEWTRNGKGWKQKLRGKKEQNKSVDLWHMEMEFETLFFISFRLKNKHLKSYMEKTCSISFLICHCCGLGLIIFIFASGNFGWFRKLTKKTNCN